MSAAKFFAKTPHVIHLIVFWVIFTSIRVWAKVAEKRRTPEIYAYRYWAVDLMIYNSELECDRYWSELHPNREGPSECPHAWHGRFRDRSIPRIYPPECDGTLVRLHTSPKRANK